MPAPVAATLDALRQQLARQPAVGASELGAVLGIPL